MYNSILQLDYQCNNVTYMQQWAILSFMKKANSVTVFNTIRLVVTILSHLIQFSSLYISSLTFISILDFLLMLKFPSDIFQIT